MELIAYFLIVLVFLVIALPVITLFTTVGISLNAILKFVFKWDREKRSIFTRNTIEKAGYFFGALLIAISVYYGITSYDWDQKSLKAGLREQIYLTDGMGILGVVLLAGTFQVRKNRKTWSVILVAVLLTPIMFLAMIPVFSATGIIATIADFSFVETFQKGKRILVYFIGWF